MIKTIDKISYWIDAAVKVFITSFLIIMTVVLAVQIFLRYFFQIGIIWSDELSRFAMIAMVYLGAAVATRDNSHITVSIFEDWKPGLRKWLGPIQWVIMIAYSAILIKVGIDTIHVVGAQSSANMGISMSWIYAVIPLSAFIMIVHLAAKIGKKAVHEQEEEI